MLRKYSNSRNLKDNIQLGALTAFSAGMANIASLLIFFAFSSNITGYYAVLAAELMKGNLYNAASVMLWIFTFFIGSFLSNFIVIHFNRVNAYLAHAAPIVIEILCLLSVGIYGQFFYQETLTETKALITLMILAMGLQNGLTASISNFAVKTTHLTGASTDMAILMSMFTKAEYRNNAELTGKASLLGAIFLSYLLGATFAGLLYFKIGFGVFYVICFVLIVVIFYDYYKLRIKKLSRSFAQEIQA